MPKQYEKRVGLNPNVPRSFMTKRGRGTCAGARKGALGAMIARKGLGGTTCGIAIPTPKRKKSCCAGKHKKCHACSHK